MSTYQRYREARNSAWRALLLLREKTLPVDADALAEDCGVAVHPAPDPRENARLFRLTGQVRGVCVSLRIRGSWHIFVREKALDEAGRRFAVAHELGHILLGHETRSLAPGVRCFCSNENPGDLMDDPEEFADAAADMFAVRLLAPACVLHELHVDTPAGIMALCGLPPHAAAIRAERMELLNERDVFYTDPLERQVRDAFRAFLLSARQDQAAVPPADPAPWADTAPAPPAGSTPPAAPAGSPVRAALPMAPRPSPEAPPARQEAKPAHARGFPSRRRDKLIAAALLLAALALLYWLGKR